MTTGDTIVITDLHIGSPWTDHERQRRVRDAAQRAAHGGAIILAGDATEEMAGIDILAGSRILDGWRHVAEHVCPVIALPGNWPHDDRLWLNRVSRYLSPITIHPEDSIRIRDVIVTHGAQWEPRRRFWELLRPLGRYLPAVMEIAARWLPSELRRRGSAVESVVIGAIHERAARHADRLGATVIMGHTHRAADIRAGDGRVIDLGTAGQAVGMPLIAAVGPSGGVEIMEVGT